MRAVWLFPGQGAQVVGMGRDVAESSARARAVYERVDARLEPVIGCQISKLCFEGPEEDLKRTSLLQPALVATSVALLEAAKEKWGMHAGPVVGAGHSLGEYSALVAAGAMDVADAAWVVHKRGAAMQDAVPEGRGAMSAIMGVDAEVLNELCHSVSQSLDQPVSLANLNAPGQIVIAGAAAAVAAVNEQATQLDGCRVIPLNVSAPFHCALMKPAAAAVERALGAIEMKNADFPIISNVDAILRTDADELKAALVRQVDQPVQWTASMEALTKLSVDSGLEFGPGKVLRGLMRKNAGSIKVGNVSNQKQVDALAAS